MNNDEQRLRLLNQRMSDIDLEKALRALGAPDGEYDIVDADTYTFEGGDMPKKDDMKRIEFVLPESLKAAFEKALANDDRRQSDVLRELIEDYCRTHDVDVPNAEVNWGGDRSESSK